MIFVRLLRLQECSAEKLSDKGIHSRNKRWKSMMKSKHLSSDTLSGRPPSIRIGKTLLRLATWKRRIGRNKICGRLQQSKRFSSQHLCLFIKEVVISSLTAAVAEWQEEYVKEEKSKHERINSCCGRMTKKVFRKWRFLMKASLSPLRKISIVAPLVGALKWVADSVTSAKRSILQQNQNLWQNQKQPTLQTAKVQEYWWSWGLKGPLLLQQYICPC